MNQKNISQKKIKGPLNMKALLAMHDLALVLKRIHIRLCKEGYRMIDGELIKLKKD